MIGNWIAKRLFDEEACTSACDLYVREARAALAPATEVGLMDERDYYKQAYIDAERGRLLLLRAEVIEHRIRAFVEDALTTLGKVGGNDEARAGRRLRRRRKLSYWDATPSEHPCFRPGEPAGYCLGDGWRFRCPGCRELDPESCLAKLDLDKPN